MLNLFQHLKINGLRDPGTSTTLQNCIGYKFVAFFVNKLNCDLPLINKDKSVFEHSG